MLRFGTLEVRPLHTPGHTAGMLSFLVSEPSGAVARRPSVSAAPGGFTGGKAVVFTGDTLFAGSVGGVRAPGHTTYTDLKDSIMGTLMELPSETDHPSGPCRRDDASSEEWEHNPFIRVWRGLDAEGAEPCTALGEPATLVLIVRRLRRRHEGLGALGQWDRTTSCRGPRSSAPELVRVLAPDVRAARRGAAPADRRAPRAYAA